MLNFTLNYKWTVSHARDSYGYNVISLYVNQKLVARCNGGGYDMKGTVLGAWVEQEFKDRLLLLKREYYGLTFHDPNFDPGKAIVPKTNQTVEQREKNGDSIGLERYQAVYQASSKTPTKNHTVPSIDGAWGQESVKEILGAIGGTYNYVGESRKDDFALVTIADEWEVERVQESIKIINDATKSFRNTAKWDDRRAVLVGPFSSEEIRYLKDKFQYSFKEFEVKYNNGPMTLLTGGKNANREVAVHS